MRPTHHLSSVELRQPPEHKPVREALLAFAQRKNITLYVSMQSQRNNRQFALWQKLRAGRITDQRTLKAIEADVRLKHAFAKFDKEGAC